ncbi:holo-ACP synthase [Jeotgalicoccus meleagridis]|jgi:holo-[acyl-carrier protein] synthase|uniref:Holo-[acyl-carrier-protein] synthase n=1 Tax=Jeotgalicoccus meleagridis TaxID=2759181 RepID=A0A6V7R9A8_9STAP|nr:holo-ACP synthase [Jeotgalicoccus meleagridis]CAD2073594.1 Holo-[acyl-carrier-protein] synthase [Jeotgalicoccus meleagridis]
MIKGLGTDIIELSRISKVNKDDRLAKRILSEKEWEYYKNIDNETRKISFLGGRFAVKEAYSKALGTGIGKTVSFNEITCINDQHGKPLIDGSPHVHVSISHSRDYATATVIIEGDINV